MILLDVEWNGLVRRDAEGREVKPVVNVYFTATGWQPYTPATWTEPSEGGFYDEIAFVKADICPESDEPHDRLTNDEVTAAAAWFGTYPAQQLAQDVAIRVRERFAHA